MKSNNIESTLSPRLYAGDRGANGGAGDGFSLTYVFGA
jgi:hypothetical protein